MEQLDGVLEKWGCKERFNFLQLIIIVASGKLKIFIVLLHRIAQNLLRISSPPLSLWHSLRASATFSAWFIDAWGAMCSERIAIMF